MKQDHENRIKRTETQIRKNKNGLPGTESRDHDHEYERKEQTK